jgi:hypothetical protein
MVVIHRHVSGEDTDIAIDLENHATGVETASSSVSTDLDNLSNRKGHETETKKSNVSSDLLKVGLLVTTSICCTDNLYHFVCECYLTVKHN